MKPWLTPVTMFATSVRVSPCSERCSRPSVGRSHRIWPSSILMETCAGRVRSRAPFGPSTFTRLAASSTLTELGTGIGSFPIRDKLLGSYQT